TRGAAGRDGRTMRGVAEVQGADRLTDRRRHTFGREDLCYPSRIRGGDLHGGLVGHDLDDGIVGLYPLARLLEPTDDLHFDDAFSDGGQFEFGHDSSINKSPRTRSRHGWIRGPGWPELPAVAGRGLHV